MDTLVLDTQGFPFAFVTWQRAVNLYFQDRATVVTDDAERILRSSSFEMGFAARDPAAEPHQPEVAAEGADEAPQHRYRDNSSCQYCGRVLETREYTIDHVVPRARGGHSEWSNLTLACVVCNKRKSNLLPHEAGLVLRQKPYEPS